MSGTIEEARIAVENARQELKSSQAALDDWMNTRHLGGYPLKTLDLNTMREIEGRVVDVRSWESREGQLRASVNAAHCRLQEAEDGLRDLRLKNLEGCRIRVPLYGCVDQAGNRLHLQESGTGTVFGVLGSMCGVRLDSPTGSRQLTEVFCPNSAILFID